MHNININNTVPTNPITSDNPNGTDIATKYEVTTSTSSVGGVDGTDGKSNFSRTITLGEPDNRSVSTVERDAGTRYGNASNVRMEIRYGHDNSIFSLEKVFIDYIKSP